MTDTGYLEHILAACDWITSLAAEGKERFTADERTQDSVIRKLEIIGEASGHLTQTLINRNPQVPWLDIIGMRHRLIHGYFGVDLGIVWTAASEDVPKLRVNVRSILADLASGGGSTNQ